MGFSNEAVKIVEGFVDLPEAKGPEYIYIFPEEIADMSLIKDLDKLETILGNLLINVVAQNKDPPQA